MNNATRTAPAVRTRVRLIAGVGAVAIAAVGCFPEEPSSPTTTTSTTSTTPTTTSTTIAPWDQEADLVVSKTSGLNPDGETITISGSGYNPNAYSGTRQPAVGLASGVYVVFGKFSSDWAPTTASPTAVRQVITQRWAAPQATIDAITATAPGLASQFIPLNPDGTFSFDVQVAPSEVGTEAYGVATYAASIATADFTANPSRYAPHEQIERVTFAPKITSDLSATPRVGDTVTVKGVGFVPSANGTRSPLAGQPAGVYVAWGRYADNWRPSLGAPSSARTNGANIWALPNPSYTAMGATSAYALINPDGSFTVTLAVSEIVSANQNYGIYTYPGSGAVNAAQELSIASVAPAPPVQVQ